MRLVSVPANPVPENVVTGMLKTPDGVSLRFARWAPPPGRKGTVCLFQGRTEFIEKYFETIRELRARGFAVTALDWRGQGLSDRALADPRKGHVEDFAQYDIDLEAFMTEVVLPDCPPPLFAIGHSTGAAILLRAAFRGQRWFDRIVLSTPMIELPGLRSGKLAKLTARV
ncbi:MAG: alpha/beta hydrolase, partial [Proteobacteria bacterium]|nr:alpha/beta hydrolase [Pseudomonadota bacterium]